MYGVRPTGQDRRMLTVVAALTPNPPPSPPPGPQPVQVVNPAPIPVHTVNTAPMPLPVQVSNFPAQEEGLNNMLVDLAQVVGAFVGAIALFTAIYAIRKAKKDLTDERRRLHELVILRDVGDLLARPGPSVATHIRGKLLMLRASLDDFPLTRAAVGAEPLAENSKRDLDKIIKDQIGKDYIRSGESSPDPSMDSPGWRAVTCAKTRGEPSIVRVELDEAVKRRMK